MARPTFFAMAIIIAALIPVFTLQRVEGRIFRPLALTYASRSLGALVFALTLVPALCALCSGRATPSCDEPRWIETLRERYRALARPCARATRAIAARRAAVALVAAAGSLRRDVGTEFLPELDEGDFVDLRRDAAEHRARRGRRTCWSTCARRMLEFPEVLADALASTAGPRTAPTTRA